MATSEKFAKEVRRVLTEHGTASKPVSTREACRRSGVSYTTISNMMHGMIPTAANVAKFVHAFGEDPERWKEFVNDPDVFNGKGSGGFSGGSNEQKMLAIMAQMSVQKQQALLAVAEAMLR